MLMKDKTTMRMVTQMEEKGSKELSKQKKNKIILANGTKINTARSGRKGIERDLDNRCLLYKFAQVSTGQNIK